MDRVEYLSPDKRSNVVMTTCSEFDKKIKTRKAGVVLCTRENNQLYFGFGIDFKTKEITCFGGKVEPSDKDSIAGALREFKEETMEMFKLDHSNVANDTVVYNKNYLIIFHVVTYSKDKISEIFHEKFNTVEFNEILDIKWLCENDLNFFMKRNKFYKEIVPLVSQIGYMLKKMRK